MANSHTMNKPIIEHSNPLSRTLLEKLDYDQLTNCMRCGFCLPACPTFKETGVEAESPRGRIALMKAAVDGLMEPDPMFKEQMNHCLGCRACEPACPADVKYGQLIEQARDAIEDHTDHSLPITGLRKLFFDGVFPHRSRLKWLGRSLQFYQKSGLQRIARGTGIMRLFPLHMREMEGILPAATARGVIEQLGTSYPAKGEPIARVALFRGCIMDVLFAGTNVNTVKLLSEAGFEVFIPETQVCCGALHAHSGEMDAARELAKKNIAAFKAANVDYIVSNAGGCGALLIEYDHLLHEDKNWHEDASWFATRVIDVSQLIMEKGRIPSFADALANTGTSEMVRITYQDSCHLRNAMKGSAAPRQLMKRVANAQFIEMKESDRCCGSAGIYNVTQPEMAGQLLEHKMEHANQTNARYMLTSNPGCLLQMKLGIQKHKPEEKMEAMHIVDFLHERLIVSD
ncbi:glycolate oxidase iron-sulfur subunit [Paenibacillus baekrokdamisoli]|uniref:Glycolate oxidase iron-sulfur subunit n=1 Tax=Paenibacillus baekrokdamisoli TaxID=1712516 RepID=A0A3G9JNX4_9BACL|nr:(Fe-S)-binding protein [Paenibacillus baekrokdamisoli]MBB3072166.1 glycolate oxidase iron-sulfur subunit [Paenibacillus baekrokdamisoli]BBH24749.1 glycolate oxidase iron-sulfur subunit [Paenibacillus baekrokdamisoli]